MRIVIVSHNASYQFGGEAAIPLRFFEKMRDRNIDSILVTHARVREELEQILKREDRDRVYFVEENWVQTWLWLIEQLCPHPIDMILRILRILHTDSKQRQVILKLSQQQSIDLVHQPVPVSPRYPSLIDNLEIPVIMGPFNGGMEYPQAFQNRQSFIQNQLIRLGRWCSDFCFYIFPAKLKAQIILVANQRTKSVLPEEIQNKTIMLTENALNLSLWQNKSRDFQQKESFLFVTVARLEAFKAIDLLLEAFVPVAKETNAKLEIIGDGSQRKNLENQVDNLGLKDRVIFSGWCSQKECVFKLQQADVMVHPSLYECGGMVILEAMAMELPVIATKWGGPAEYIEDGVSGILIEPSSRENLIEDFTKNMFKLYHSPQLREQLGRKAKERIYTCYDQEKQIDQLVSIYRNIIDKNEK